MSFMSWFKKEETVVAKDFAPEIAALKQDYEAKLHEAELLKVKVEAAVKVALEGVKAAAVAEEPAADALLKALALAAEQSVLTALKQQL